jgi:hypothetical protein
MSELLQSGHHPDADQLSAFIERTLPPHEREQTLAHLAICPDCREIVALSLPPVDEPLPQPAPEPWFFGWNMAWPAIAAAAALVLVIVFVRNTATTRKNAGVHIQVAASNPPAPLPPLETPEVSNANRLPDSRQSAVASGAAAVAKPAQAKTTFNARTVEGPLPQTGLPQPAPASGTQAIHGQLRSPGSDAAGVGLAMGPPQKEPALPIDHFQQNPPNSSDANAAAAFDRLIQAPPAPGAPQAPKPAPAPLPPPAAAAATNQTVEVAASASAIALPSTSSDFQLSQTASRLTHSLPSNLSVLSMVANAHQVLAIDFEHSLFLSDDAGNHWRAVRAQWKGRAVKVGLASSVPLKQSSTGTAAGKASNANFGAIGGPVATQTPAASASLSGRVTDTTGAAIADASVVVGYPATNARTVTTDRTGRYVIDGLVPGSYQVAAQAIGFNKQQLDVTVTASQQSLANLTLSVGQATETVSVSAPSEQIATLSVAKKNKAERSSASQSLPVFEITTDTGEHWTSPDGNIWKHN